MRGCPGSGKSTLARSIKEIYCDVTLKPISHDSVVIFSTDDYWMEDGKYNWQAHRVGEAHAWNQARASDAMLDDVPVIIIDNTNTTAKEARPYVESAKQLGYEVEVVESNTPWAKDIGALASKNTHNVPRASIEKMLARYEPLETFKRNLGI